MKKLNLKIVIPVVVAVVVLAIVGIVFLTGKGSGNELTKEKIYEIGETVKTEEWEFTLTNVQYGKKRSISLAHEDYLLPEDNSTVTAPSYESTTQGNTVVVITYNIKFLGKANTRLHAGFKLDFDNGYIIENNSNISPSFHIRNDLPEGYKIDNSYQALWEIKNYDYEFKPLTNELKIREYIEIPDNVANDTEKPLILKKGLRKSGSIVVNSGGFIKYRLK